MLDQFEALLCRIDRLALKFSIIVLSLSLFTIQLPVKAQVDCTNYNQCSALQGENPNRLNGPITYSFDEASLNVLPDDEARQDFKNRMIAAANDWSAKTGISIELAQPGQTANVEILVSSDDVIRKSKGLVNTPPFSSQRVMLFSDNFSTWSSAGKDWIASHEWCHIMGLNDVSFFGGDYCPGVETIARHLVADSDQGEIQLKNGYNCEFTGGGNPDACSGNYKLPEPQRPNPCDVAKVQSFNSSQGGGDSGGGDTGGGGTCVDGEDTYPDFIRDGSCYDIWKAPYRDCGGGRVYSAPYFWDSTCDFE